MRTIQATLISKKTIGTDVVHFVFSTGNTSLEYEAGHYIILTLPAFPLPIKRLYSLAGSSLEKNTFELLVKIIPDGKGSQLLNNLPLRATIDVSGPAGLFSQKKSPLHKTYMTTGTGFAPIRSFLLSNQPESTNGTLYWGLRDFSEVYLLEELLSLRAKYPSFMFYFCLSQEKTLAEIPAHLLQYFRMGHIDKVWKDIEPSPTVESEYYLCGSRTVIESLRAILLEKGVQKERLFFEKY